MGGNQPATRAFLRDWIGAAAAIGSEVVFWDEPHWYPSNHLGVPDLWTCRCEACQRLFQERHGAPLPTALTPEVRAFRERSLMDLLGMAFQHARALGMRNALCPLPRTNRDRVFSAWDALTALPALDIFGTDPYWVGHTTDAAAEAGATNIAVWGYLGCAGMSSAACGRPELVWEIIGEASGRLQQ